VLQVVCIELHICDLKIDLATRIIFRLYFCKWRKGLEPILHYLSISSFV
jgi:hypothetical protein